MNNFFTNYPDTDFHELNLDWLLSEWSKYRSQFDALLDRMDTIEKAFEDLQDFVTNYFDNLDVQEEINNKLQNMFDNGELQVLLQRVIDNPQVMTLDPMFSISKYRGYYDHNAEANNPSFLQAACTDGSNMYLFFMNPVNQGDILIEKRSNSTKELLATGQLPGGYHANCADYYNGMIYLSTIQGGIMEINALTLGRVNTYTFDKEFRGFSIDNDGTMYAEWYNDLYIIDDLEQGTYHHVTELHFDNQDLQSGVVRDGWLYEAGINPSCVYKINAQNGLISKIYPIDRYVDQYPVGEVESVAMNRVSGELYVISCAYWGYANYRMGQIFKCYLTTNSAPRRLYSGGSYQAGGDIHVDQGYRGGLPDGSVDKPFSSLSQALLAFQSPYRRDSDVYIINLHSDCADEPFVYRGTQNITLAGNGYKINSVWFRDASLSMYNVIIQNDAMVGGTVVERPFYAAYADVHISDITIEDPDGAYYDPDYAMVFSSCTGSCFNLTLNTNKDINSYRSSVIFQQAIKDRVFYLNDNQPNMSVAQSTLNNLTPAQINNIGNMDLILLRVVKSSVQTLVQFPVDAGHVSQCTLHFDTYMEYYNIQSTKLDDGTFRFGVASAMRYTPSTGEWTSTSEPTLAGVYFFSMN